MLLLMHSWGIRQSNIWLVWGDMLYFGILHLGIVICLKCCSSRWILNYYLFQWKRLTAAAITIFQCHLASASYKYTVESCYHLCCLLTDSQVTHCIGLLKIMGRCTSQKTLFSPLTLFNLLHCNVKAGLQSVHVEWCNQVLCIITFTCN